MARLEKISSNSWKQPFADRKKQFNLWGSHTDVADLCRLEDSTKRLLSIQFEKRPDLNVVDRFQITSGREISFPKSFQELIKPVILGNPESFFVVQILDGVLGEFVEDELCTTGSATVKTRVGQDKFRKDVLKYWKRRCTLTGVALEDILRASHIKPWRVSSDLERLDKYNGLLLTPTLDTLFDKGLISFMPDTGSIVMSEKVRKVAPHLGVSDQMRIRIEKGHRKYLKYHFENVFER